MATQNAKDGIAHGHAQQLVVPNRLSELRRMSEWVRRCAREFECKREVEHALELTMNEALANIVNYAYRDDAPRDITLSLVALPGSVRVQIEDDGEPFNPLATPPGEPPQDLEKSRPTGRGIPLMRNLADELQYARRDGKNVLTMLFNTA